MTDPTVQHELDTLLDRHARLSARIEAFDAQKWLNERERTERKRLQKLKLATKDRIVSLRARTN